MHQSGHYKKAAPAATTPSMARMLPAPLLGTLRPRDDELVVAFPSLVPVDVEDVEDVEVLPEAAVAAVLLELRRLFAHSPWSMPFGQQRTWVVLPE